MGGVVKKVTDVVKKTVINPIKNIIKAPIGVITDVIRGKSLKKSIAKHTNRAIESIAEAWNIVGNHWLGINDKGFLGIKGGVFSKMGKFMQDLMHDHLHTTVGIGIAAVALLVSIVFPPAYSLATAAVVATGAVTSNAFLILGSWYLTLGIVSLGVSFLASAVIDAAMLVMYGVSIFDTLNFYEEAKETLRIANLATIFDGSIFDRMAGGWMYASQFAGDVYYDAATPGNCDISVGGKFELTPHAVAINIGYVDSTLRNMAGDDYFHVVNMTLDPEHGSNI